MKALVNARIYDYHDYYEDSYILFDNEIIEIGKMKDFSQKPDMEIIDIENDLVLPGFVCAHTHLYSAFARGLNLPFNPKNFKEILKQLWWKLDHFLDLDMVYYSAFSFGLDQIKKGTTCFIDHHASGYVIGSLNRIKKALIDDLKVRAILCFETSDRYNQYQAIEENINFINKNKTDKVSGLFGLHASFTLSDETLKKVSENLNNSGIHIHVAESIKDEEDSIKKYGKTVVKRLDDFNLINSNSILVHCTNISDSELEIIKKRDAVIAINVTSNMNNAVGLPNIKKMDDLGIRMMIGNDGLIQSMPIEYLNTYYTAHHNTNNPVGYSLESIKKMIINSYDYVNSQLNTKIGRIKKGYKADLITVQYTDYTPVNKDNIFGHIFFGLFPGLLPRNVISNGQFIINNYLTLNEIEEINRISKDKAKELWKILEKEGNELEFKD